MRTNPKGTTMNISTRIAGGTAAIGLLLALAACGSETISDTDPGNQPAALPAAASSDAARHQSADSAERQAAAEKARQDRASALRWARGQQQEGKLKHAGHPGQY